jgi:hypothetical protein
MRLYASLINIARTMKATSARKSIPTHSRQRFGVDFSPFGFAGVRSSAAVTAANLSASTGGMGFVVGVSAMWISYRHDK